jgi:hypothetical protein
MKLAGDVSLGFTRDSSSLANWSFDLVAEPGPQALVAVSAGHVLVRRGLEIDTPTELPVVDTVADGSALESVPLTVNGVAADDDVSSHVLMLIGGAFAFSQTVTGTTAKVAPAALFTGNDRQFLSLTASNGNLARRAFTQFDSTTDTTIAMLPRLESVVFTPTGADWTAVPDGDVQLSMYSGLSGMHATATKGWLETQTELAFDTDIPGFLPEWKLGTVDFQSFQVSRREAEVSLSSEVLETPGETPGAKPALARRTERTAELRANRVARKRHAR